ncbi:MAG: elongation factor Ts [Desulfovibrio sp.]|nr:elongation factor Ts [Desulfovibrio sp.]
MAISAQMVKDLREKTGAGMMDCKKALVEVGGDMEKAVDWLRQKGMAKAEKKSGRATAEGLVTYAVSEDGKNHALASLLCETDFVARGDQFQDLARKVANTVLQHKPADGDALNGLIGDEVKQLIASVGENMQLGKFACYKKQADDEVVGQYVHNNNKIGVLVFLKVGKPADATNPEVEKLARNLAMQVAASNPLALDPASLDPAVVERERAVYIQKAKDEGKPDNIVEKIADGAVRKFEKEVCLLAQPYIRDDKKSVADIIRETEKEVGDTITVTGFERIQLAAD